MTLLNLEVKVVIACKIDVDAQKQINLLTFDIITCDYNSPTEASSLGTARTVQSFVCSILDGC
jgi:hypothetical protein